MTLAIEIAVEDPGWDKLADLEAVVAGCLEAALNESGATPPEGAEVSFLFCADARIHELNRDFRGKDRPTNVLSFPGLEPVESAHFLGDIALACETITREAVEQGKPFEDHCRHLIVHGFLHLLGYDHEAPADATEMESLEVRILRKLGIADPYSENGESGTGLHDRA